MEVHHHPQLEHKPKPWKEYILEYIMIFLAVTTGFFAESLREHINDRAKEKEYLVSLVSELKSDTAGYSQSLQKVMIMRPQLDSLYVNVTEASRYNYVLEGKWNTPVNEANVMYLPALTIIQQLKSSGNLRLIDKKDIGSKIIKYETFIEGPYKNLVAGLDVAAEKLYNLEDDLCDESEFNKKVNDNIINHISNDSLGTTGYYNMTLKIRDAEKLNQLANSAINYNARNWGYINLLNKAKKQATVLLQDINREYGLEGE